MYYSQKGEGRGRQDHKVLGGSFLLFFSCPETARKAMGLYYLFPFSFMSVQALLVQKGIHLVLLHELGIVSLQQEDYHESCV